MPRLLDVGDELFDLLGESDQVDFGAAAGRAGDDFGHRVAESARFENPPPGDNFLGRISGQADPERVADSLHQERADADSGFDDAARRRPGFGDADVERIIRPGREFAVRRDGDRHA